MNIEQINDIFLVQDKCLLVTDSSSAIQLLMDIPFKSEDRKVIVYKEIFSEDFFKLSTGLAGEILQKFVTYQYRVAIVGDFSVYDSKSFQDFIRESNRGKHFYFVSTIDEALSKF